MPGPNTVGTSQNSPVICRINIYLNKRYAQIPPRFAKLIFSLVGAPPFVRKQTPHTDSPAVRQINIFPCRGDHRSSENKRYALNSPRFAKLIFSLVGARPFVRKQTPRTKSPAFSCASVISPKAYQRLFLILPNFSSACHRRLP